jgi:hypothetical protein
MIPLLVQEGCLSAAVLTGFFTNHLITSFKLNILDPLTNRFIPAERLDRHISMNDELELEINQKDEKGTMHKYHKQLRWQTFIKDLVIFAIIAYLIVKIFTGHLNKYKAMPVIPGVK